MMNTMAECNKFFKDYYRHTHPRRTSATADARILSHTAGESARVNTVWELRSSAENNMVAQTIVRLLSRPAGNESLCLLHFPDLPVDNKSW